MAEATPAREGEEAGNRPVLDVTASASTPLFSFSFSLTIADRPLAAGALIAGIGGGVALAALLYRNPELVTGAVRGALEGPGLQVGNIAPGSIIVELQCNTKESFLLFLEDFETKKVKQRLEEEFFKIGFKEELEVAIMNDKEVYAKLGQIRKLDKTGLEEEKGEKLLLTEAVEVDVDDFNIIQPSLLQQLRIILDQYPNDGQILKELIQNAEDAGASQVKFLYDKHSYGTGKLHSQSLSQFQGPALYAYNNVQFAKDDWKGIRMLSDSIKVKDPMKVGRFGLGFKSVFQMTDSSYWCLTRCKLPGFRITVI